MAGNECNLPSSLQQLSPEQSCTLAPSPLLPCAANDKTPTTSNWTGGGGPHPLPLPRHRRCLNRQSPCGLCIPSLVCWVECGSMSPPPPPSPPPGEAPESGGAWRRCSGPAARSRRTDKNRREKKNVRGAPQLSGLYSAAYAPVTVAALVEPGRRGRPAHLPLLPSRKTTSPNGWPSAAVVAGIGSLLVLIGVSAMRVLWQRILRVGGRAGVGLAPRSRTIAGVSTCGHVVIVSMTECIRVP